MVRLAIGLILFGSFTTIWINRAHLRLAELDKYEAKCIFPLSMVLLLRFFIGMEILICVILSPILAYEYGRITFISSTFPVGEVYNLIIVFLASISILAAVIMGGTETARKVQKGRVFFEKCMLAGLSKERQNIYATHGHWRWQVIALRISRWIRRESRLSIPLKRIMLLIAAAIASFCLFYLLVDGELSSGKKPLFNVETLFSHPSILSPLLIIVGIPIAFMIWLFRDQNNREQIENQRKDINLRDFQRLAEWAAGMHLPEDKTIETKKSGRTISSESSINEVNETVIAKESYGPSIDAILRSPSRRDAATALQIAAVYQLAAFLRGDFGQHFQRPAFQLLRSIWLVLIQSHLNELPNFPFKNREDVLAQYEAWQAKAKVTMGFGLGEALTLALGADRGQILRSHSEDLPNIVLPAFDTQLPALQNMVPIQGIDLEGMRLRGAQFQGANFYLANLQRGELFQTQLRGANFQFANLQEAELALAMLDGSNLSGARMQGAKLGSASLTAATLFVTNLQGAILDGTRLDSAQLNGAMLEGALLLNIQINDATSFNGASIDEKTRICIATRKKGTYGLDISTFPNDHVIDVEASKAFRERLSKSNGLDLTKYRMDD